MTSDIPERRPRLRSFARGAALGALALLLLEAGARALPLPGRTPAAPVPALPEPLPKPPGEIRILLLGDSVAYGAGASSPELAFGPLLEARLHRSLPPGDSRRIRVLNRARPALDSAGALEQLASRDLLEAPDWVVLAVGVNDLATPLMGGGEAPGGAWAWVLRHSRLAQAAAALRPAPAPRPLAPGGAEAIREAAAGNLRRMGGLLARQGVRGIWIAEPTAFQKPPSEGERAFLQGQPWAEAFRTLYPLHVGGMREAARDAGWRVEDATDLFAGDPETRFLDAVHFGDEGHRRLAGRLSDVLLPALGLEAPAR